MHNTQNLQKNINSHTQNRQCYGMNKHKKLYNIISLQARGDIYIMRKSGVRPFNICLRYHFMNCCNKK
jgi:hypothetical protein